MDPEFLKWLASLGVGGAIATVIFHWYRKDVKLYTDQWRGQSEMLIGVVKENTSSNTKLITVIDGLQRRLDRDYRREREND